jgi:hypothetical protein
MSETPANYQLTFEERPEYLYAEVKAESIDEKMARSYLDEIADRCRDLGAERLMIYRDIPAVLDATAMYFTVSHLREVLHGVTTAFVNPYENNEKMLHFGTTVGFNLGEKHELFNDPAKAESWLLTH